MPTVLREQGLRVVIYVSDHAPSHVHVLGDGETKIALTGETGRPEILRIVAASLPESRRALRIVQKYQPYLLQRWNDIHG